MAALVAAAAEGRSAEVRQVVGEAGATLHRYAMLASPMDDVLLEAIAEAAGVRVAFSNGWRYGAPIPPGPVTVEDLWSIVPTNPPVMTTTLTGSERVEMLEEYLERSFAADPFEQSGGYAKRNRTSTGVDAVTALRQLFEARRTVSPPSEASEASVFVI